MFNNKNNKDDDDNNNNNNSNNNNLSLINQLQYVNKEIISIVKNMSKL